MQRHELSNVYLLISIVRKPQQDEKPKPAKMEYDRTYIAQLPGRSRKSFVRKRRYIRESDGPRGSGFGLTGLARALIAPPRRRRSFSYEERVRVDSKPTPTYVALPPRMIYPRPYEYHTAPGPSVVTSETVHTHPGHRTYSAPVLDERIISNAHTTRVITRETQPADYLSQHQCGSCGKYRSPSYQTRHPLAPGEIPRPSTCRSCIRKHTSSESTDDEIHLKRKSRRYRKKYRHRRGSSHLYVTDTSSAISTGEADVRIIRRARSVSRDRRRLRSLSTSRDRPRIEVTIEPTRAIESRPVKSILRRRTSDPVEVVERTRYVERSEPSLARYISRESHSRGSSQYYEYSDEEPVEVYCTRGYDGSTRRMTTESYRPGRVAEYGYDGDYDQEYGPIVRRRRSESVIAQHGTPIRVEREVVVKAPRRAVSPRDSARRRLARSIEYETVTKGRAQPPERAVRVIDVSEHKNTPYERRRRGHVAVDRQSGSVAEGATSTTSSTSRRIVEEMKLPVRRREHSPRELERDSSDDYPMPGNCSPAVHVRSN